jgi:hypothetical protein
MPFYKELKKYKEILNTLLRLFERSSRKDKRKANIIMLLEFIYYKRQYQWHL